jgi:hypothetical protein
MSDAARLKASLGLQRRCTNWVRATVDAYLIVPALHRCSPNRFRAWELAKMEALQRETFL